MTDYSPDSQTPQQFHGPPGVGRVEIVRKPANYGWPYCFKPDLPEYPWNVNLQVPMDALTHQPVPAGQTPQPYSCGGATVPNNDCGTRDGGAGRRARPDVDAAADGSGRLVLLPRQQRRDAARHAVLRRVRPERADRADRARLDDARARACSRSCYTGGVGPHGAAKYNYDPANPSTKKFPPYYDNSVIMGEFTQDTLREVKLDSQNRVFKINGFLDCGAANVRRLRSRSSATTRWTCSGERTVRSTC